MLDAKVNFKGSHKDLACRYCGAAKENQEHILSKCEIAREITDRCMQYEDIFKNNSMEELTTIANTLIEISQALNDWKTNGKITNTEA